MSESSAKIVYKSKMFCLGQTSAVKSRHSMVAISIAKLLSKTEILTLHSGLSYRRDWFNPMNTGTIR